MPPTRRLPERAAFWLVAATLALLVSASSAPSPVFPVYQQEWGLSATTVTVVFAVYAGTLLLALLTVGSLSDHLGRRTVVLAGLAGVLVALAGFLLAGSAGWLIAARALQGVGTGAAIGALGAWLLDLGGSRTTLAQTLNGAAPPVGLMVGGLGAGLLVQYAPAPARLVYAVLAVLLVACAALLLAAPETSPRTPGARASLVPSVRVPAATRPVLVALAPALTGSWALGGLFIGLGPSVAAGVLGRTDHLVGGLVVASLTGTGALVGVLTRNLPPRRVAVVGSAAFLVGPALLVVALQLASTPLFFVASVVSGVGFGAAFQGGLRAVVATAPAAERAGVLAAVYVMCYLAFGVPSVVGGLLTPLVGLRTVAEGYAALVALLGAASLLLAARSARRAAVGVPTPRREAAGSGSPVGR
ncbi:MFS transporter [Paenibacillus sp. TRM 82003]|uniref:MFS transporter n=1 Tax=Kineococcus sp. TRM81007 TaxID=2925831 RepID=UPI001F57EAA2|nr:MFS transporter [Kineococcus sp. TRM81007]MCI2237833.1 MFS transporter [Kineococcus sp. TRM81007]MCI3926640.1 MFS transporter [Paenibacillus sp. TRM 82003]